MSNRYVFRDKYTGSLTHRDAVTLHAGRCLLERPNDWDEWECWAPDASGTLQCTWHADETNRVLHNGPRPTTGQKPLSQWSLDLLIDVAKSTTKEPPAPYAWSDIKAEVERRYKATLPRHQSEPAEEVDWFQIYVSDMERQKSEILEIAKGNSLSYATPDVLFASIHANQRDRLAGSETEPSIETLFSLSIAVCDILDAVKAKTADLEPKLKTMVVNQIIADLKRTP